jgi:fibro-slime domain-containing protein
MVQKILTGPDWKPKINPASTIVNIPPLETWYTTVTFPDGTSNAMSNDLTLVKNYDGRWIFDSDKTGGFFPLDNFNNPNNVKYLDDYSVMHNFHFTMEMHLQFTYHAGIGQDFAVIGDDDIFVYVNNKLAIDLGGLNYYAVDTLNLDKEKNSLQLVDGQVYTLDLFYAEREPYSSNLIITTSLDLQNTGTQSIVQKPQPLVIKPYEPAGLIIPMKSISGKYYSINGRKLVRKNVSTQPLIRGQQQQQ